MDGDQSFSSNYTQASDLETLQRCDGTIWSFVESCSFNSEEGQAIVLPLAPSLRKQIECLLISSNPTLCFDPFQILLLGVNHDPRHGKDGISAYVGAGADVEFAFLVEHFD